MRSEGHRRRSVRPGRVGLVLAVTGSLLALAAPIGTAQPPPAPQPPIGPPPAGTSELGREIYFRECAWCHEEQGRGTRFGPSLLGTGAASTYFMVSTGRMPIPEPVPNPERGEAQYPPEVIRELAEFVGAIAGGPDVPAVDPAAGDLAEGGVLYVTHCAACHSATGSGAALTGGVFAPNLWHNTPLEISIATRIGGAGLRTGNMPLFGPDVISDAELDSLVRYVVSLQELEARGGARLGRVGPVVEGVVAWGVGMLLLVLFIVWIGERAR